MRKAKFWAAETGSVVDSPEIQSSQQVEEVFVERGNYPASHVTVNYKTCKVSGFQVSSSSAGWQRLGCATVE